MKHLGRKGLIFLLCLTASVLPAAAFWSTAAHATAEEHLLSAAAGSPPQAESVEASTVSNVMIEIQLSASDPDGDPVSFRLEEMPRLGTASVQEGIIQYTPAQDRTGTDRFTYCAVDPLGNVSEPAEITVRIEKNKAGFTYADMNRDPAHLSALRLAQEGILVGERIGTAYFLHPNQSISRSEFIAMAAAVGDLELTQTAYTDFADDSGLSPWVKPYISAAANAGLISGYQNRAGAAEIRGEREITVAEASVILSKLLSDTLTTPVSASADPATPVWAAGAAAVLSAADVMPDSSADLTAVLTRSQACTMLARTLDLLEG